MYKHILMAIDAHVPKVSGKLLRHACVTVTQTNTSQEPQIATTVLQQRPQNKSNEDNGNTNAVVKG